MAEASEGHLAEFRRLALFCNQVPKLMARLTVAIDDDLVAEAMQIAGVKTNRGAVELGLRKLVKLGKQSEVRKFRGKLAWKGDLESWRSDE